MAFQYAAAAEEIKELSNEELARLVLAKKQDKQVEASTKALKENVEKLKELKKGSREYKSMLATMAEEINVLGGAEGVVDSSWVSEHLDDVKLMVAGDKAAADRIRKAWAKAWASSQLSAESSLGKVVKEADLTGKQLKVLTNKLYEYKLTGKADLSQIKNELLNVGIDATKVAKIINAIAGTSISYKTEYEYLGLNNTPGGLGGPGKLPFHGQQCGGAGHKLAV